MQETWDLYDTKNTIPEECRILAGDVAAQIVRIKVCQDAINQYCKDIRMKPPAESKMYHGDKFLLDFLRKLEKRADTTLEKVEQQVKNTIKDKKERDEYLSYASYKNDLSYTYEI